MQYIDPEKCEECMICKRRCPSSTRGGEREEILVVFHE